MKTKLVLSVITLSVLCGCASTTLQSAPDEAMMLFLGMPIAARKCNLEASLIAGVDEASTYAQSTWKYEPERFNTARTAMMSDAETFEFTAEYCKNVEIEAYRAISQAQKHLDQSRINAQIQRENQRQLNQDLQQLNRDLQQMNRDNMQIYQNMQNSNRQCFTNSFTGITTCV
ncbi:hypothetical protein [Vibrio owensii]|uniref:hypothetical protein n=1 Tax=Vibrio owensii TaxID=696485 RepID=UPI004068323F